MGFYNCSVTVEDGGLNPIKEAARYIGENCFCFRIDDAEPLKMYFNTRYSYTAAEDGKPCYGIVFEPFVVCILGYGYSIIPLEKITWNNVSVIHNVDSIKMRLTEYLMNSNQLFRLFNKTRLPGHTFKASLVSLGNNPHILSKEFNIPSIEYIRFWDEEVEFIVPEEENQN
jgi:hypothetical protein